MESAVSGAREGAETGTKIATTATATISGMAVRGPPPPVPTRVRPPPWLLLLLLLLLPPLLLLPLLLLPLRPRPRAPVVLLLCASLRRPQ